MLSLPLSDKQTYQPQSYQGIQDEHSRFLPFFVTILQNQNGGSRSGRAQGSTVRAVLQPRHHLQLSAHQPDLRICISIILTMVIMGFSLQRSLVLASPQRLRHILNTCPISQSYANVSYPNVQAADIQEFVSKVAQKIGLIIGRYPVNCLRKKQVMELKQKRWNIMT